MGNNCFLLSEERNSRKGLFPYSGCLFLTGVSGCSLYSFIEGLIIIRIFLELFK